jgi:magnesium-transporting ATPase (P-type)
MSKKVFRPFNTWGIVLIAMLTTSVLAYSIAII